MIKYIIPIIILILVLIAVLIVLLFRKNNHIKTKATTEVPETTSDESDVPAVINDSKLAMELSEVDLLLKNSLGDELQLSSVNDDQLSTDKKYVESSLSVVSNGGAGLVKGGLPIAAQAKTAQEIAKSAENGLFTATASPELLSKFKDGTLSTMVRPKGSKGIQANAGFKEVSIDSLTRINPSLAVAAGMQAMAMISGQYYMDQISEQLKVVNATLEELKDYHNDEKIGTLINARKRLFELSNHVNSDETDINEIKLIYGKIGDIYEEYRLRFDKHLSKLMELEPSEWKSTSRIEKYNQPLEKLKLPLQIATEADKLCLQARLAEISARKKNNAYDKMLPELILDFKNAINNSFNVMLQEGQYSITSQMMGKAGEVVIGKKFIKPSEKKQAKLLESVFEDMKEVQGIMTHNFDGSFYQKAASDDQRGREILLLPADENNPQRIFIEAN